MSELDDLDAAEVHADGAGVAAAAVELLLPHGDGLVADAVLELLVCGGEVGVEHRGDGERLRRVHGRVEHEVGLRGRDLAATDVAGERVRSPDPGPQLVTVELVDADRAVFDDESRHGVVAVRRGGFDALGAQRGERGVADAVERVGDRLLDALGSDAALPPGDPSPHAGKRSAPPLVPACIVPVLVLFGGVLLGLEWVALVTCRVELASSCLVFWVVGRWWLVGVVGGGVTRVLSGRSGARRRRRG